MIRDPRMTVRQDMHPPAHMVREAIPTCAFKSQRDIIVPSH
jgi:hypothetical protein